MVPHDIADDSAERAADTLRDFYRRSQRVIDRAMARHGASYARARLLLMIVRDGPLRSTDLASAFSYAPRTVTEAIDGLERDGLVRRDPDPDDRRAKRVSLTAEGERAAAGAERARRAHVEHVFGALGPGEREDLTRLLTRLNERLEEMEQR
jgi:DNA-binding MarR family transcriptional regulator